MAKIKNEIVKNECCKLKTEKLSIQLIIHATKNIEKKKNCVVA